VSVSVVIPAYNSARYVGQAIESALQQDVQGLEVVVVDDGSADDTAAVVRGAGGNVRYFVQQNSGTCGSPRNLGAKHAAGDFLAFLDADDVMCAGQLNRQLEAFRQDPALAAVMSDYRNFGDQGDYPQTHFETCNELLAATGLTLPHGMARLEPLVSNRLLLGENFSIASSGLYRRSAWVQAGGFDLDLRASEDFDFIYRVAHEHPIAVLGSVGLRRRMHASNLSNQLLRIASFKVVSRRKLLAAESDPGLRRLLRESVAMLELHYSRAIVDCRQAGWAAAYLRALRLDPWAALRHWRVLVRGIPFIGGLRAMPSAGGAGRE
jgi:glycosyltransferase involved in cell wall biosynthesis